MIKKLEEAQSGAQAGGDQSASRANPQGRAGRGSGGNAAKPGAAAGRDAGSAGSRGSDGSGGSSPAGSPGGPGGSGGSQGGSGGGASGKPASPAPASPAAGSDRGGSSRGSGAAPSTPAGAGAGSGSPGSRSAPIDPAQGPVRQALEEPPPSPSAISLDDVKRKGPDGQQRPPKPGGSLPPTLKLPTVRTALKMGFEAAFALPDFAGYGHHWPLAEEESDALAEQGEAVVAAMPTAKVVAVSKAIA